MDYDQALDYIHGTYKFGSKLGLDNIKELLNRLGKPHEQFQYVHVAGTNGKGSTTAIISHILHEAGYRVGMFISPYLEDFTERIQVDSVQIQKKDLARITHMVKLQVEKMVDLGFNHPTEFEIVTAIGFVYFAQKRVDIAVVEVGLGGRLDATNVVDQPLLSIITSIGFDHMDILGNTLSSIAYEKSGIIKNNRPVVSYPQLKEAIDVIETVANNKNAPLYTVMADQIFLKKTTLDGSIFNFSYRGDVLEDLNLKLIGEHQLLNAATALTSIKILQELGFNISNQAIFKGLSNTRWPGRLEVVRQNPTLIIDGAHNAAGAQALSDTINNHFINKKVILVLGVLKDKEIDAIINRVCPLAHSIVVTKPDNPRSMDPRELGERILKHGYETMIEEDISKALDTGIRLAGKEGIVLICGSLYLVGFARRYLKTKF